ncbi:MAG: UDP-N-acetylglucosamine 2-epimerase (non-hydrolyzing) [bacterium]
MIKLSPILRELERRSLPFFIIHTNQHYSQDMDAVFFEELGLPKPLYNLEVGSGSHGEQTGKMIMALDSILQRERPDHLYVQGDTNSVIAGALAAAKVLSTKISHVEAGLRSYDRTMPEEVNRIIADHISDYLFVPTNTEADILRKEGIPDEKISIVGNTIVDAVLQNIEIANANGNALSQHGVEPQSYHLLTLHRPSNVEDPVVLQEVLDTIHELGKEKEVTTLFPCHPRTRARIQENGISLGNTIRISEPIGYSAMLQLMQNAQLILTDSGGIQEEACILKVPCVTLRFNTERPDTISVGGNVLAGNKRDSVLEAARTMLAKNVTWYNPYGDGNTAQRIVDIILRSEKSSKS